MFIIIHYFSFIWVGLQYKNGCRGVVNSRNHCVLAEVCSMVGIRGLKRLRGTLARLALLGSYRIWLARKSQDWSPGELISSGQL